MTHTWRIAAFFVFGKCGLRLVKSRRVIYFFNKLLKSFTMARLPIVKSSRAKQKHTMHQALNCMKHYPTFPSHF